MDGRNSGRKGNESRSVPQERYCTLTLLCAVKRRRSSAGATPARQLSFQPVAIGAVVEVILLPKPPMERSVERFREPAGRNVSER